MPELPDLTVYVERLQALLTNEVLRGVRINNPFVLRTVHPPLEDAARRAVRDVMRVGKRVVIALEGDLHLVMHLMIAGRLRWRGPGAAIPRSNGLAGFDFDAGTLVLTEAGRKRRASLHVIEGESAVMSLRRGAVEALEVDLATFRSALTRENHTLKRALTDPRILSGIGNAYSDEILHAARLSPFKQTRALDDEAMQRLFHALRHTLAYWTDRLRTEVGDGFPDKVTAFRDGMAVHGRYREPCTVCGAPVQRIVYASTESNYCARCQTGGRVLADRALSRLLKSNWPRTLEELESS